MNGHRAFWMVMYGFMALTVSFTFFRFGPIIEQWAMPVVRVEAKLITLRQEGFTFSISGHKYRDCELKLLTTAWRFNSTTEVAPVYDASTGSIYSPPVAIEAGEDFIFGPLFVKFSPASYSLKQVELRGILYYSCHALWNVSHSYHLTIFVPSPPEELKQTPLL